MAVMSSDHRRSKNFIQWSSIVIVLIFCINKSLLVAGSSISKSANFHFLPGLMEETYTQQGDINIGASVLVTSQSETHPAEACSKSLNRPLSTIETTEAIAFAVDLINRSPLILPNVTLGFVVLGSCTSPGMTIATSLSFLPRTESFCNGTVCLDQAETLSDFRYLSFDVIGTLGPGWSSLAVPVSSLYAVARLPMVGSVETSDELSDKGKHPYFFRIVPPDMYKVQAILKFIFENRWSYVSVLYVDGAYGQHAFDNIQKQAHRYGVCIATSHRLLYSTNYTHVVTDLLLHSRARAVVLFMFGDSFQKILQAVVDNGATGHFTWIGAGGLVTYTGYQYEGVASDPAEGTFIFELYSTYVKDFYEYLRKQKVGTSKNPWMKSVWEYLFDCSFVEGTCDPDADVLESRKYKPLKATPLQIDAVLTMAQAAHNLLMDRCPHARGGEARACIDGELFREYLKKTVFDGFLGRVEFDENQDVKGKYIISQFVYDYQSFSNTNASDRKRLFPKKVGIYDIITEKITYFNDSIFWSHLNILERIIPWIEDSLLIEIPESVCSGPCLVGEYMIQKEVSCCWECRKCRENERLVDGNTSCEMCPAFTWPDPASAFTTCIDIPLTYSTFDDTIPIVLVTFAVFTLVINISVFIAYVIYRNERVIKASSRELSIIQLVAIFGGYINIILLQTKPTHALCSAIFFFFSLTFVLLYSPLLVKAIRIFRIFKSGKTNKQRLGFISPGSQLFFASCLVSVQVILSAVNYILYSPGAKRTQPIWSEKLVELSCDLTLPGLASFLGYNIVLVSLCSVFAFKTRKLPDNFNESQFISMCVSTTLLIWLAFIPTYFTADREFVRVFLLSVALLLNHTVALVFLFLPKLYAVLFLPPEEGNLSSNRT